MLARRERTFMLNSVNLHMIMNLRCSRHTKHAWAKETRADNYPVKFCRRAVKHILKMERWNLVQHVSQQATTTQIMTAATVNSVSSLSAYLENREHERVVDCDLAEWNHWYREREERTCGYVSTRPRNLQLDMSGPKVNKYGTSMVSVCLRCCRKNIVVDVGG